MNLINKTIGFIFCLLSVVVWYTGSVFVGIIKDQRQLIIGHIGFSELITLSSFVVGTITIIVIITLIGLIIFAIGFSLIIKD